jgi:hypothetical protein
MKRKINTAQKNNSKRRSPKSNKTIINWSEYNKALVECWNYFAKIFGEGEWKERRHACNRTE